MMRVHRFVTNDFTVRAAAVDATAVVAEMQALHKSLPLATLGVGRAMVGALLMASHLKQEQQVGILLKGNGPLGSVYAEASFEGHVRGYCPQPHYEAPDQKDVLNLGKAMGFGQLTVSRHLPFQKQPHYGTVEMSSGEVGSDIAHYLLQSHQIRSLVSVGVYLDTYGQVKAAGGVLIEVMPGVEDAVVARLQANSDAQKEPVSKLIFEGKNPQQIIAPYMQGLPFTELDHNYEMKYFCPCDEKRVSRALTILGEDDLQDMIHKNEAAEIVCQMCGKKYQFPVEKLEELIVDLRKNALH